jgi:hypothetical protein
VIFLKQNAKKIIYNKDVKVKWGTYENEISYIEMGFDIMFKVKA